SAFRLRLFAFALSGSPRARTKLRGRFSVLSGRGVCSAPHPRFPWSPTILVVVAVLGSHDLVVVATHAPLLASRKSVGRRDTRVLLEPRIASARARRHCGNGRRIGRLPFELANTDTDETPGDGAGLDQRLLHTEPRQPVRQVSDGFVVVEVRLT